MNSDAAMTATGGSADADRLTEQMWREVVSQLRGFVRRRIADPDRADDLIGEILLRIHRNVHSVDDRERLANWVFRVARNAIIDEYRRAGRDRERLVPTPVDATGEDPVFASEDPAGVLDELAKCLRPLLDGLPPDQRRAVQLIDLEGWPQARAAQSDVLHREPLSISDCALYPLFSAEVITLMRDLIPEENHTTVAVAVVISARRGAPHA